MGHTNEEKQCVVWSKSKIKFAEYAMKLRFGEVAPMM